MNVHVWQDPVTRRQHDRSSLNTNQSEREREKGAERTRRDQRLKYVQGSRNAPHLEHAGSDLAAGWCSQHSLHCHSVVVVDFEPFWWCRSTRSDARVASTSLVCVDMADDSTSTPPTVRFATVVAIVVVVFATAAAAAAAAPCLPSRAAAATGGLAVVDHSRRTSLDGCTPDGGGSSCCRSWCDAPDASSTGLWSPAADEPATAMARSADLLFAGAVFVGAASAAAAVASATPRLPRRHGGRMPRAAQRKAFM